MWCPASVTLPDAEGVVPFGERLQGIGFWNDLGAHEHDDAAYQGEAQEHQDTNRAEDFSGTSAFFTESEAANGRQSSAPRHNPTEPSRQAGRG